MSILLLFEFYLPLASIMVIKYNYSCRARRGGSGALYLQPAIAGLNSCPRHITVEKGFDLGAMKIGSCAIQGCKPRQVRKKAAVSSYLDVPQGRLIRAFCHCTVRSRMSTAGARLLIILYPPPI